MELNYVKERKPFSRPFTLRLCCLDNKELESVSIGAWRTRSLSVSNIKSIFYHVLYVEVVNSSPFVSGVTIMMSPAST